MNKTSPAYILLFMLCICIVFGSGVATVHYATQDMLERNRKLHRYKVLARAFDIAVDKNSGARAYESRITDALTADTLETGTRAIHLFTRQGDTADVGFIFSGMGFWDEIRGILVLGPDLQTVQNIQILDQSETPGLGARITEPWFTDQFRGLSIDWDAPADKRVIVGSSPNPDAANRVDAITGASQTSIALGEMLNRELETFQSAYTQVNRSGESH